MKGGGQERLPGFQDSKKEPISEEGSRIDARRQGIWLEWIEISRTCSVYFYPEWEIPLLIQFPSPTLRLGRIREEKEVNHVFLRFETMFGHCPIDVLVTEFPLLEGPATKGPVFWWSDGLSLKISFHG